MKYIEFGIGNRWLVRTETELEDGSETEARGIVRPILYHSFYFRIWVGKTVWIWSSKEGFKKTAKSRHAFKLIFGIVSDLER
ncbi:DUF3977 family protein [Paenibacillus solanacearum]|uniref:DUF3977 family protein n=1 Tax=Paenibacillus solanacearum TaxID=2048548 RepID=UPI001C404359|nr:DUF3977 family protein [Paenibacillus solanacearum]